MHNIETLEQDDSVCSVATLGHKCIMLSSLELFELK